MARLASFLVPVLLIACTSADPAVESAPSPTPTSAAPSPSASPSPSAPEPATPRFDRARAFALIEQLAALGPREATSAAYRRAAREVEDRLRALGYDVRRQRLRVPAGVSGGVAVPAGGTWNVIAEPERFDPREPHAIVGAHLDTVPRAPGANDNASGIAVMLELARMAMIDPPAVPVVLIAFAAEESRGSIGGLLGSRHYVGRMTDDADLRGMISLDRVGIGSRVRVCTGVGPEDLAALALDVAVDLGIRASPCRNPASDHVSFGEAGFAGVRLLGAEHPSYHTPRDLPDVISRAQLRRIGRLAWETVRALGP